MELPQDFHFATTPLYTLIANRQGFQYCGKICIRDLELIGDADAPLCERGLIRENSASSALVRSPADAVRVVGETRQREGQSVSAPV